MKGIYFVCALLVVLLTAVARCSAQPDKGELRRVLNEATGIYTELPTWVPSWSYTGGPILGNGHVGVTIGGDDRRQILYINRVNLGPRALGGITVTADKGEAEPRYRYEQDIHRAEVRSDVTVHGCSTKMTAWVAAHDPLVVVHLENNSSAAVTYHLQTWTKSDKGVNPEKFSVHGDYRTVLLERDGVLVDGDRSLGGFAWIRKPIMETEEGKRVDSGRFRICSLETGNCWYVEQGSSQVTCRPHVEGDLGFEWEEVRRSIRHVSSDCCLYGSEGNAPAIIRKPERGYPQLHSSPVIDQYYADQGGRQGDALWVERVFGSPSSNMAAVGVFALRVLDAGDQVYGPGRVSFKLEPGQATTFVAAVEGGNDYREYLPKAEAFRTKALALVKQQSAAGVAGLRTEQLAWWQDFWEKSFVDLGDPMWHKFWYGCYYAMACCCRSGGGTVGLWGAWVNQDDLRWSGLRVCNYNYQAPWYGVHSGNHPELAIPYAEDMKWYLLVGKARAAEAGYRGATFARFFKDKGFYGATPTDFEVAPEKGGVPHEKHIGALLAYILVNHYFYTLDEAFLREDAYPFMREVAFFIEDAMEFDGKRYVIESSAREGTQDLNPAFALAQMVFHLKATIEASRDLGVDEEHRDKWQHMIDHMSELPTTEQYGSRMLMEAERYVNQSRRSSLVAFNGPGENPVALEAVHPAEGVNLGSSQDWIDTVHNTIEYLNSDPNRLTWDNYCALPKIYTQCARTAWNPNELYAQITRKLKLHMWPNLTVINRGFYGGGIEHAGMVEAVNSMLLQGHEGILRLFPAWPRDKDARFVSLRTKYAFLVSSELKGGTVQGVTILSERGRDCTVQNPWAENAVTLSRADGTSERLVGESFTFQTEPGEVVVLSQHPANSLRKP